MTQPGFFRRKIVDPLVNLLRQGITPEKIALSLAIGITVGVFPVLGSTSLLCALIAIALRLNLPAIQLVNWLVYPVQVALLLPFFRLGEALFRVEHLPLSPGQLVDMFRSDFWGSIKALWGTTLHAIVAWVIVGLPAMALLYFIFLPLLRKLPFKTSNSPT